MKCLLKSGDTQKICYFAGCARPASFRAFPYVDTPTHAAQHAGTPPEMKRTLEAATDLMADEHPTYRLQFSDRRGRASPCHTARMTFACMRPP